MQEFHDSQERQLQKLCNFELGKDDEFKKLSIFRFLKHIDELNKHNHEEEMKYKK